MNKFLLFLSVFVALGAKAQENRSCQILRSILEYKPAVQPYYFDKNVGYSITFYDTTSFFETCSLPDYYGRKVQVTNDSPASAPTNPLNPPNPSNYVVIIKKRTNKIVRLILNYKSSGAYCEFTLKRKGGRFRVVEFKERYL